MNMRNVRWFLNRNFHFFGPVILLSFFLMVASIGGCTDGDGAGRTLRNNGFTNVEITGWRFFSCGEDDVFRTGFEATSPTGIRVTGAVCGGWFKGNTIRFD